MNGETKTAYVHHPKWTVRAENMSTTRAVAALGVELNTPGRDIPPQSDTSSAFEI